MKNVANEHIFVAFKKEHTPKKRQKNRKKREAEEEEGVELEMGVKTEEKMDALAHSESCMNVGAWRGSKCFLGIFLLEFFDGAI